MNQIKLEIFNNKFLSIVEEMAATLRRCSFSQKIKEGGAYSCGLFDSIGRMISYVSPIPIHLSVASLSLKVIQQQITEMSPGDIYIINDPFKGGTHLSNITLISPIFGKDEKKPLFFVVTSAHHSEVGGSLSGGIGFSKSIIEEGVFIEPIKLMNKDKINNEFLDAFFSKVAAPKERESDLKAQIITNQVGVKGIELLLKQYKFDIIKEAYEGLMNYSESLMKKTIATIPHGEYSFTDYLDGDGLGNKKIKIKANLSIKKDEAIINFTKSNEVVRGPLNAVYSITCAAVYYVFRALSFLSNKNIPLNEGCMRPISVVTKKHTILNASYPSSVSGGVTETSQRVVDVLLGALSKAVPNIIPSASQGTMNNITIKGFDSLKNKNFIFYETIPGGVGACDNYLPPDGIQSHMMNILNESIELIEHRYPIRVIKYEIRKHSGGSGSFWGSNGVVKQYQIMCDAEVTIISERRIKSPYGLNGGKSGKKGNNCLIKKANGKEIQLEGKCSIEVKKGDIIIIETPGGGGWGKSK